MKAALLAALILICGCASSSDEQTAGLPPPAETSRVPYPTSATRMDAVCRQPDAQKTNVCEGFRYGGFGGSH